MAKVTLTLPDDLYWEWQEEIPRRRVEQKESAIQALRLWLDEPRVQPPQIHQSNVVLPGHPENELSAHDQITVFVLQHPEHRGLLEALVYIIRAGDLDIIRAISNNLDTFVRLARLEGKHVSDKTIEVAVELTDDRENAGGEGHAKKSRRTGGNLPSRKPKAS
jgi:hypothetical protein